MKDFYLNVRNALRGEGNDAVARLIKRFNADPKLVYTVSPRVVTIYPDAADELKGIFKKSLGRFEYRNENEEGIFLAIEIPFIGIFDSIELSFHKFFAGKTGNKDMCSWLEGDLLEASLEKARELNMQIALGHTHPVIVPQGRPRREYGAICSKIYWTRKDLEGFGDFLAVKQLESGIYEKYGGDYGEMWTFAQENEFISNFALIMSPALNQLGVFEVNEGGRIIYHPWRIIEP